MGESRGQGPSLSWANQLTLGRIFLVPLFLTFLLIYRPANESFRYAAAACFFVAVLTDWVDGMVARAMGQRSRLGSFLDPFADKLLLWGGLTSLALWTSFPEMFRVPLWALVCILIRDGVVLFGMAVIFMVQGELPIMPSLLGKWACALQMASIFGLLLFWPFAGWVLRAAVLVTVVSGVHYVWQGVCLLAPALKAGWVRTPSVSFGSHHQIKS